MYRNGISIFNDIINMSAEVSADVAYSISRMTTLQENISVSHADTVGSVSSDNNYFFCAINNGSSEVPEYYGSKCGSELIGEFDDGYDKRMGDKCQGEIEIPSNDPEADNPFVDFSSSSSEEEDDFFEYDDEE